METFIFELRMLNPKKKWTVLILAFSIAGLILAANRGGNKQNRGVHVILILSNYRKCMGKSRFLLKTDHGLLCTPDLVYCFFELLSYSFQRESIKYMNSGRISWLWILIQIFEFPAILPWLPMMQLWVRTPLFAFPCFNHYFNGFCFQSLLANIQVICDVIAGAWGWKF